MRELSTMDKLLEMLQRDIFRGVTPAHVIGLIVLLIAINFIWKLFRKKERPEVYEKVRCLECDWRGEVSKYHRVCRKCAGDTLQTTTVKSFDGIVGVVIQ